MKCRSALVFHRIGKMIRAFSYVSAAGGASLASGTAELHDNVASNAVCSLTAQFHSPILKQAAWDKPGALAKMPHVGTTMPVALPLLGLLALR